MNQIKFGIILNYISVGVTFAVGLIYTPILIRYLGQTDYGVYALATALAGYLTLLDMGIGNAIVRYVAQNQVIGSKEKESRLIGYFFKFFCCISVLTLVIGFSLVWNLQYLISDDFSSEQIHTLKWMIFILTFNFAIGFVLNTFSAVLQAYQRFIYLRLMMITNQLLTPILSFISLMVFSNVIVLTLILTIVNISILIINSIYFKKKLKIKLSFKSIDKNLTKEVLGYSLIIFTVAIADKLYWQTDQILLGMVKNPEVVAIYAIAIQFVMIFMSLSIALNGIFLPHITHIVSEENHLEKLNALYITVSKLQTFVIGLFFSGFVIIGEQFIQLWVGEEFNSAYVLILILMSTFAIDLIQNLGTVVMQAKAKYKFRAYLLIICSVLNIIVSIPIINMYGSIGTAIVTAVFVFIGNVLILNIYFHKVIKLDMIQYWIKIGKMIVIIIVTALIGYELSKLFTINNWINLFVFAIFYAVLYCFVIFIMYLSKNEKKYVVYRVKKVFK